MTQAGSIIWRKNGDHPLDGDPTTEGSVVRYFRDPRIPGNTICSACDRTMHEHGWIDNPGNGEVVCPGDAVWLGADGLHHTRRE